jgi:PAS domain S-box-containing protein
MTPSLSPGFPTGAVYELADELAAAFAAPRGGSDELFVTVPEVSGGRTGAAPDTMIAMLRTVIDLLPGNVFAKDRDGRYLIANEQTERALGADRVALVGFTDAEILDDPEEAARLVEVDRRVMASGVAETLEEPVTLADGSVRTWLSTKAPLRDACGEIAGVIGYSVDITERKAAEAALAANEAQLAAVLDALPVGIIIADAKGEILRDNAASRELWGMTPATRDWRGYGDWVGYDPATGERIAAGDWAMSRALLNGDVVRGELVECERFDTRERRRYLNSAAPVRDGDGNIVGGVVAQLDVTDGLPAGVTTAN